MNSSHDQKLIEIANKVEARERLSLADGLALYASYDLSHSAPGRRLHA
jgi:hypothetical protein